MNPSKFFVAFLFFIGIFNAFLLSELHCENVKCKKDNVFDNEECPPDSVKAASYVPAGNCCPVYPG